MGRKEGELGEIGAVLGGDWGNSHSGKESWSDPAPPPLGASPPPTRSSPHQPKPARLAPASPRKTRTADTTR